MNTITTKDGTSIFYKDWGTGPTVVLSHGWPLSADAWDAQMLFLGQQGFRVIAHDRRGHGRSEQTWTGNDYDTFADDFAELLEKLNLKDATLVGHSMGGGEITRYIGRHGNKRVRKAVIIGGIPPVMLKSDKSPGAFPFLCSMESVQGLLQIAHSFTWMYPCPSMATTSRMPSHRKGFGISSGAWGCNPRPLPLMSASRPSPKRTSRKT